MITVQDLSAVDHTNVSKLIMPTASSISVVGGVATITTPIPGSINYFDSTHSPVGLWNFNGTLADLSGNANNLSLSAGNLAYCDVVPGKLGLMVLDGARYQTALNPANLGITGDLTIQAILIRDHAYTNNITIAAHAGTGAASTENINYAFILQGSALTALQRLQMSWEHSAGTGVTQLSTGDVSLPPIHTISYLAVKRVSNVVTFYHNGLPFGPASGTLTAPTGGAGSVRFMVGSSSPAAASPDRFVLMSLKVVNGGLSDAQIKAEYNRTLGPAYGLLA